MGRAIGKPDKIEGEKIAVRFGCDGLHCRQWRALDLTPFGDKTVKEAVALFNEAARHAEQTAVEVAGGQTYRRDNETGAIVIGTEKKGWACYRSRAKVAKAKGQERAKVDMVLDRLLEKDNETVAYVGG